MWTPDETLLQETVETLNEMVSIAIDPALPEDERRGCALGALECLGTLAFMGYDPLSSIQSTAETGERAALHKIALGALDELDGGELDEAAGEILRLLADLTPRETEEELLVEERLVEALRARDAVELILEGARHILGDPLEIPLELEAAMLSFDEVVSEELWRMLRLGTRRAARCAWAAPSSRSRLWWWQIGADLPATALDDLGTAARVIHLFPAARDELERLIRAEARIDQMVAPPPASVVISFDGWAARRSKPDKARIGNPYALAAATAREDVIFEHEGFSLSLTARALRLDLAEEAELAPGAQPSIELDQSGPWECLIDEEIPGQFLFPLAAKGPRSLRGELKVPLAKGAVVIPMLLELNDEG
jgi:hypothetical protein